MFVATENDSLLEPLPVSATVETCFCAQLTSGHKSTLAVNLNNMHKEPFHTYLLCNNCCNPASTHLKWFRSQFVSCPLLVNPDLAK